MTIAVFLAGLFLDLVEKGWRQCFLPGLPHMYTGSLQGYSNSIVVKSTTGTCLYRLKHSHKKWTPNGIHWQHLEIKGLRLNFDFQLKMQLSWIPHRIWWWAGADWRPLSPGSALFIWISVICYLPALWAGEFYPSNLPLTRSLSCREASQCCYEATFSFEMSDVMTSHPWSWESLRQLEKPAWSLSTVVVQLCPW